MEAVVSTVSSGNSVTTTGFGTFTFVDKKATTKRNPKTGAPVKVPAKRVPKFRPGKAFKESVNK
ncbi:MAG: HU family DNA-binding protein [Candidatus Dojkabacteria bacterium]|nr:HU family DNA-binding protein [Candidatus Dojkabacteria bacterium]